MNIQLKKELNPLIYKGKFFEIRRISKSHIYKGIALYKPELLSQFRYK